MRFKFKLSNLGRGAFKGYSVQLTLSLCFSGCTEIVFPSKLGCSSLGFVLSKVSRKHLHFDGVQVRLILILRSQQLSFDLGN